MSLLRRGDATAKKKRAERAADGSMTLMEHLTELRDRLFKAALAVLLGLIIGIIIQSRVFDFLIEPYCSRFPNQPCGFNSSDPTAVFLVELKIGLYVGLILSAPVWLYQLWAFIAPGLHRNERKWAYGFAAVAAPLFALGAVLAHFVVAKGLAFLLPSLDSGIAVTVDIDGYIGFVTGMMLVFGVAFEFPLLIFLLNVAGVLSAKRLLGWWRPAVFLMFVFTAFITPTPDPFGMTALAIPMCGLYFAAVGAAFLNEKRKARAALREERESLNDNEASELDYTPEPIEEPEPITEDAVTEPAAVPEPVAQTKSTSRRDDIT